MTTHVGTRNTQNSVLLSRQPSIQVTAALPNVSSSSSNGRREEKNGPSQKGPEPKLSLATHTGTDEGSNSAGGSHLSNLSSWFPTFNFKKEKLGGKPASTSPISRRTWRSLKRESRAVKTEELKATDIVIALMGPTGSGKSSFISTVAGVDQGVGHDLVSKTQGVQAVRIRAPEEDIDVVLVDTPGFDDTFKSDREILELISEWLKEVGYKNILLDGILYLHRISDNRMAGTPLKNLELFEKICGRRACTRVMMVTTMWGDVESEVGKEREDELTSTFWAPMISQGSRTVRYQNTLESAWEILEQFTSHKERPVVATRLQKETVQQHKTLNKTDAGQELFNKLEELDKQRRSLMRKFKKQMERPGMDEEMVAILREQHDGLERDRQAAVGELQKLKLSVPQRYLKSFSVKRRYR